MPQPLQSQPPSSNLVLQLCRTLHKQRQVGGWIACLHTHPTVPLPPPAAWRDWTVPAAFWTPLCTYHFLCWPEEARKNHNELKGDLGEMTEQIQNMDVRLENFQQIITRNEQRIHKIEDKSEETEKKWRR